MVPAMLQTSQVYYMSWVAVKQKTLQVIFIKQYEKLFQVFKVMASHTQT